MRPPEDDIDERRVRTFLAPLTEIKPATRRSSPSVPVYRRRRLLVPAIALVALLGISSAVTAIVVRDPLEETVISPDRNSVACLGVVGVSGQEAEELLTERGYRISWRFMHWGNRVQEPETTRRAPTAITGGFARVVKAPPSGSLVWDAAPGSAPGTAVVSLQDADDVNAPEIEQPDC